MYKGNSTQRRFARPQFKKQGFKRQSHNKGSGLDVSRFINKAVPAQTAAPYVPKHRFADFAIEDKLKAAIAAKGYVTPTPIQDQAIPHILAGKDVVGIANTGTGKTGAFLIPIINKILLNPKEQALIIAPTRELAVQIEQEFKEFSKGLRLFSACVIGGASIGLQMRNLRYHNHLVIGTPGRLKDLMERKIINLSTFNTVVLDEADRMLDMGFIGDMKLILSHMPTSRHTLFFSATLSREIEALISQFLREPVRVSVKTRESSETIDQDIVRVSGNKLEMLHNLLADKDFHKVLVFGRTKHGVERLARGLDERGFKAESIHGNKSQSQRQRALARFKASEVQVLVATDVAARGLDIDNVSHVINYDMPDTYEEYVHRIGRTGRGGKNGKALTFVGN